MFKFYTGNKINIFLQETSENSFLLNKTAVAYVLPTMIFVGGEYMKDLHDFRVQCFLSASFGIICNNYLV